MDFNENKFIEVFEDGFEISQNLETIKESGYLFVKSVIRESLRKALEKEINALDLEFGDHVADPINNGKPNQVQQLHTRAYRPLGHPEVPIATELCKALPDLVDKSLYPELSNWTPNEIGYQRYRAGTNDWISPHRDRRTDQLLSATITITGSAIMNIYRSLVDPPDYSKLEKIDQFLTEPGTVMFLRAPGFGDGKQIIHEVMPPLGLSDRNILNLRMRNSILAPPIKVR